MFFVIAAAKKFIIGLMIIFLKVYAKYLSGLTFRFWALRFSISFSTPKILLFLIIFFRINFLIQQKFFIQLRMQNKVVFYDEE
jgi:hypothetical protein